MSILNHLNADYRPEDQLPEFKSHCCMKYTVDKQCKRCPFRQIKDEAEMEDAKNSCLEKRRGEFHHEDITIEYNNQYL